MEDKAYPMCFACGRENPISLRLDFRADAERAVAEFTPDSLHQGYDGIMHGGLVTTLLDEAMAKAVGFQGIEAVSAEIKVRFRDSVPINEKVVISGLVKKRRGKVIFTEAYIKNGQGKTLVRAEGKFMQVNKNKMSKGKIKMNRDEAYKLVKEKIKQRNLVKHCLAVEAVMRRLAERFNEDVEKWGLAGLLHDIDYEETADDPEKHSLLGAEMLSDLGLDDDIVYAVKAHNHAHGLPRKSLMDKALYASDPLTGLIVAAALIHPDKKLASIDTEFVINRYGEKSFARGADRDVIASCSEMGLELKEFIGLSLEAMQGISDDLGL